MAALARRERERACSTYYTPAAPHAAIVNVLSTVHDCLSPPVAVYDASVSP